MIHYEAVLPLPKTKFYAWKHGLFFFLNSQHQQVMLDHVWNDKNKSKGCSVWSRLYTFVNSFCGGFSGSFFSGLRDTLAGLTGSGLAGLAGFSSTLAVLEGFSAGLATGTVSAGLGSCFCLLGGALSGVFYK